MACCGIKWNKVRSEKNNSRRIMDYLHKSRFSWYMEGEDVNYLYFEIGYKKCGDEFLSEDLKKFDELNLEFIVGD